METPSPGRPVTANEPTDEPKDTVDRHPPCRSCPECGYDLRGHDGESVICPECGATPSFDVVAPSVAWSSIVIVFFLFGVLFLILAPATTYRCGCGRGTIEQHLAFLGYTLSPCMENNAGTIPYVGDILFDNYLAPDSLIYDDRDAPPAHVKALHNFTWDLTPADAGFSDAIPPPAPQDLAYRCGSYWLANWTESPVPTSPKEQGQALLAWTPPDADGARAVLYASGDVETVGPRQWARVLDRHINVWR